jgi:hypothetical protein
VSPAGRGAVWTVWLAWAAVALVVAMRWPPLTWPPPLLPVVMWGTVAAVLLPRLWLPSWRAALDAVPLAALVALHLVRIGFGSSFLVLASRGELTPHFARDAGIGDVAAGVLALALLLAGRVGETPWRRRLLAAWSVFGLIDFLNVQRLAITAVLREPEGMTRFADLPFSLLPPWIVPTLLASHLLILLRLRARRG